MKGHADGTVNKSIPNLMEAALFPDWARSKASGSIGRQQALSLFADDCIGAAEERARGQHASFFFFLVVS